MYGLSNVLFLIAALAIIAIAGSNFAWLLERFESSVFKNQSSPNSDAEKIQFILRRSVVALGIVALRLIVIFGIPILYFVFSR